MTSANEKSIGFPIDNLNRFPRAAFTAFEPTADWVSEWAGSDLSAQEVAVFSTYSDSLLSAMSRAFLFHAVRAMKPAVVVELGTYMAGTSRIIAEALADNGHGHLFTTDPYGGERCPRIIAAWPAHLRQRVSFCAKDSMAFADELRQRGSVVDIAFIDGCHDFEYVLFDALAMGDLMSESGLMLFDNGEQPGVIQACMEFLRMNPGYRELGTAITAFDFQHPFGNSNRSDIPDTSFLLIVPPDFESVNANSFYASGGGGRKTEANAVQGVRLTNIRGSGSGTLFIEVWLRAFGDAMPIEITGSQKTRVNLQERGSDLEIPLEQIIDIANSGRTMNVSNKLCEIVLFWRPDDGRTPLKFQSVSEVVHLA